MALSERDHVLLRQIERRLVDADPDLATLFGRWPTADRDVPSGWSPVRLWMLVVFVCAFVGWTVSPPMGALTAVLCVTIARARRRTLLRRDGADRR